MDWKAYVAYKTRGWSFFCASQKGSHCVVHAISYSLVKLWVLFVDHYYWFVIVVEFKLNKIIKKKPFHTGSLKTKSDRGKSLYLYLIYTLQILEIHDSVTIIAIIEIRKLWTVSSQLTNCFKLMYLRRCTVFISTEEFGFISLEDRQGGCSNHITCVIIIFNEHVYNFRISTSASVGTRKWRRRK